MLRTFDLLLLHVMHPHLTAAGIVSLISFCNTSLLPSACAT
jgi:hypothetical protein